MFARARESENMFVYTNHARNVYLLSRASSALQHNDSINVHINENVGGFLYLLLYAVPHKTNTISASLHFWLAKRSQILPVASLANVFLYITHTYFAAHAFLSGSVGNNNSCRGKWWLPHCSTNNRRCCCCVAKFRLLQVPAFFEIHTIYICSIC